MRNLALALLAAVAAALPAAAAAQTSKPANQCFFTRDWQGWKAAGDKAMYIRVGLKRLYRVDFANGCPGLTSPSARLITQSVTGTVCSALDLDVRVSDLRGFSTGCIVSQITPLTAAEVAALPKKLTP